MVHVKLSGGLGNQLFQYACGRAIVEKMGSGYLYLYTSGFRNDKQRDFSLGKFVLNEKVKVIDGSLPWFADDYNNIFLRSLRKVFPQLTFHILKCFGIYIWNRRKYKEIDINNKSIYLSGIWQCDKYFNSIDKILKEELRIAQPMRNNNLIYKCKIENNNSVCVHIRRGDFINTMHQVCTLDYYYKAIEKLGALMEDIQLVIFSDEIQWVKKNMRFSLPVIYIENNNADYEELDLMKRCKHFIISNSSFSWWAQYLCENTEKVVIAPSKWYMAGEEGEVFQDNWILINV